MLSWSKNSLWSKGLSRKCYCFFQPPYHPSFPQLGLKTQQMSTSPVPQNKHIYTKKSNPGKPFEHLPNIWLFGQGVMRHDGNWVRPDVQSWRPYSFRVFGSNGAFWTLCESVTYILHFTSRMTKNHGTTAKTESHGISGAKVWSSCWKVVVMVVMLNSIQNGHLCLLM